MSLFEQITAQVLRFFFCNRNSFSRIIACIQSSTKIYAQSGSAIPRKTDMFKEVEEEKKNLNRLISEQIVLCLSLTSEG